MTSLDYCGQCFQKMEQWEDALGMYDRAIQLNKFEGKYYYNRAQVKAKMDRYEDAIKDYDKAIEN